MKIYFSGSHSTGKSTLVRYVSETYKLPKISETARSILSERELQLDTLRYDMDTVDSYQIEVFNRQLAEEAKYKDFVSDRCLIDILAYSCQHTRILTKLLNNPLMTGYIESLKESGVCIFFVRPSKATLKSDGVRELLNWDGVVAIDAMIKLLLEMFQLPYFQINTDSMQDRVRLIDIIIKNLK
jgi:nicotinamide riboside kinase